MRNVDDDGLKALVLKTRRVGRGQFPEAIREKLMEHAQRRWREGASVKTVARELGISHHTLAYWRDRARGYVRPVEVVPETGAVCAAGRFTVNGPHGLRVEGITLDEVAVLWRKLG